MRKKVNMFLIIGNTVLLFLLGVLHIQAMEVADKSVVFSNFNNTDIVENGIIVEKNKYSSPLYKRNYKPFFRFQFKERIKINYITIYAVKNYAPAWVLVKSGNEPYALKDITGEIQLKFKKYSGDIVFSRIPLNNSVSFYFYWLEFENKSSLRFTEIQMDTNEAELQRKVYAVKVISVKDTSVTISWDSNYYGFQTLLLGRQPSALYAQRLGGAGSSHRQTAAHLLPGNTYFFAIGMMGDTRGVLFSEIDSFTTTGITPPEMVLINFKPGKYKISVDFKTNVAVRPFVSVSKGTVPLFENYSISKKYWNKFDYTLTNLLPDRRYTFRFFLIDKHKQVVKIKPYTISTRENDIALGQKVYSTFRNPSKLVDGDNAAISGMSKSASLKRDNYLIIDFGHTINFSKIDIQWRALAYAKEYYVMAGNGMLKFDYEKKVIVPDTLAITRSKRGDPMKQVITNISGFKGRFLKVFIKANAPDYRKHKNRDWLEILEVKVFRIEDKNR